MASVMFFYMIILIATYLQDQMILFMALADGESTLRTGKLLERRTVKQEEEKKKWKID